MEIRKLSSEEQVATGANMVVILTHADLTETATNTAQTIALTNVVEGTRVEVIATRLVEPFEDASDSAFNTTTLIIGDDGSTNRLLASQELNVNGTEILAKAGAGPYCYTAANTVDAIIGSMASKALSNIDVGEVWIFLSQHDLDDFVNDTQA